MATIGARLLLAISLCMAPCVGRAADVGVAPPQWTIEQGTDQPGYAAIAPTVTRTNIDTVVLACEEGCAALCRATATASRPPAAVEPAHAGTPLSHRFK